MYESYQPLFEKLGDAIRVDFCKEKREKKMKQADELLEVLQKLETEKGGFKNGSDTGY